MAVLYRINSNDSMKTD